jgi:hypothetical protein
MCERTGGAAGHSHFRASVNDRAGTFHMSIEWMDIPARERFELLATIAEMREWRDKPSARPIRPAALELHQWLMRTCDKGPSTIRQPKEIS